MIEGEVKRDTIKLSNNQWRDLVHEEFLTTNSGEEIPIIVVKREYEGSGRHTEYHNLVFKVLETDAFYRVAYEDSVKDSMGWDECNEGSTEAIEVFPKEVKTIIYE